MCALHLYRHPRKWPLNCLVNATFFTNGLNNLLLGLFYTSHFSRVECNSNNIDNEMIHLIASAASEPEASEQGSNPNLYMWVKISILASAHCIMGPVGLYHNAARSVALKCTCVVAVWSFFHCFDFREDRVSF